MPHIVILASMFLLLPAPAATVQAGDAGSHRPNIVVLVTDDQRWDTMGCTGNRLIETPNMDKLASQGTLFENAFVTSSICAASRASIFTGLYERRHHCNFNTGPLVKSLLEQSYPALLRKAGYYTGFIGKYGVGDGKREIEGPELFDRWYGFYGQGQYFPKEGNGRHLTQMMVDQARDFMDGIPAGRAFCLSISFKAPHSGKGYLGYTPDPALADLYRDTLIPHPPAAGQEYFAALPSFLRKSNARYNYWELRYSTEEKYQDTMKDYYRLITGVDRAIGRLRKDLEQRGLAEDTVLIFLSDNGDMTGDYMLGGKELLYDVSIRVPLIVMDPRIDRSARGRRRRELSLNIDVAPTVLELAGVKIPAEVQGRSLLPLVQGKTVAWRDAFFCENNFRSKEQYYPLIEGVRTERWKYILYPEMQPPYEQLFDLEKDPLETTNLLKKIIRGTDDDNSLRIKE